MIPGGRIEVPEENRRIVVSLDPSRKPLKLCVSLAGGRTTNRREWVGRDDRDELPFNVELDLKCGNAVVTAIAVENFRVEERKSAIQGDSKIALTGLDMIKGVSFFDL